MRVTSDWHRFSDCVAQAFPETDAGQVRFCEGDIAALASLVAGAHDLTFREAAEVVTFRLPHYLEAEPLTA